ncbi:MAG TPA: hypothetical protein VGO93_11335 [Candidatus Xenobia bacterium]|jgi:hypothetical protein
MKSPEEGAPFPNVFNQSFFSRDLVKLLDSYGKDSGSESPSLEFQLRDGTRWRVSSIEQLGPGWISFRGKLDNPDELDGVNQPTQVTCGYEMVARVNFVSRVLEKKVGFRMTR